MRKFVALFRVRRAGTSLARIERALKRLDPVAREVFLMHRLESVGYPEIAERLGITVSQVEGHIAAAMVQLMRAVDEAGSGG